MQFGKEETKVSLFLAYRIAYVELTKKLLKL